ncbi:DHS-like NAD/FAD-binding domain-containing protein [Lophium mytilinum]|uniref:DHS-like NAD/FAD-binding domain-containing protein n=1 Tax=Lophium mytilinum TaxID=390894 RepID=A0A6A6QZA4_9PEZI|nr:DHS-like NAD/FAD-binding domain-containing protein [Lophium mytilinum]
MTTDREKIQKFGQLLRESKYVLALLGAGLSASSGVPTFSGVGASWRGIEAKTLATRDAFAKDARLVSEYYRERQQTVVAAAPNRGHVALAELAKAKPGFLAITQNIDDLSQRAGHPPAQLACLHGSLFATKCFDEDCSFFEPYGLRLTQADVQSIPYPPGCPVCGSSFLRPGVVLFGELLPEATLDYIDAWIDMVPTIDVMLVVGTTANLSRSAEFIDIAREKGAIIAHFDLATHEDLQEPEDLIFPGDAAETLPAVIGEALAFMSIKPDSTGGPSSS